MVSSDIDPLVFTDTKDTEGHYHELVKCESKFSDRNKISFVAFS